MGPLCEPRPGFRGYLWRPANIRDPTCKHPGFQPGLIANSLQTSGPTQMIRKHHVPAQADSQLWDLVAFVERLPTLSVEDDQPLAESPGGDEHAHGQEHGHDRQIPIGTPAHPPEEHPQ